MVSDRGGQQISLKTCKTRASYIVVFLDDVIIPNCHIDEKEALEKLKRDYQANISTLRAMDLVVASSEVVPQKHSGASNKTIDELVYEIGDLSGMEPEFIQSKLVPLMMFEKSFTREVAGSIKMRNVDPQVDNFLYQTDGVVHIIYNHHKTIKSQGAIHLTMKLSDHPALATFLELRQQSEYLSYNYKADSGFNEAQFGTYFSYCMKTHLGVKDTLQVIRHKLAWKYWKINADFTNTRQHCLLMMHSEAEDRKYIKDYSANGPPMSSASPRVP